MNVLYRLYCDLFGVTLSATSGECSLVRTRPHLLVTGNQLRGGGSGLLLLIEHGRMRVFVRGVIGCRVDL